MTRAFCLLIILCNYSLQSQTKRTETLKYKNGKELLNAMYDHYAPDKWYRYFTFSQEMEYYRNDSVIKRETWHEAYQPGALLIKYENKNASSGRLYKNFIVYSFKDGKIIQESKRVHELLLVGLDVYFFKPESTISILDSLGYDLSKIRQDEYNGRKVFVVGADKGDLKSRQFWLDAEHLYMHKVIFLQKDKVYDVVFDDYKKLNNNWVAMKIIFKANEKLGLIEKIL